MWNEDILQIYEQIWHLKNNIPSIDDMINEVIESKKGELIIDLLALYKESNIDNYERVKRGEILDEDFKNLKFDFRSLKLNITKILEDENVVFIDKKIYNSSKKLLFEY